MWTFIQGDDLSFHQDLHQGKRKHASACTDVSPSAMVRLDTRPDKFDSFLQCHASNVGNSRRDAEAQRNIVRLPTADCQLPTAHSSSNASSILSSVYSSNP